MFPISGCHRDQAVQEVIVPLSLNKYILCSLCVYYYRSLKWTKLSVCRLESSKWLYWFSKSSICDLGLGLCWVMTSSKKDWLILALATEPSTRLFRGVDEAGGWDRYRWIKVWQRGKARVPLALWPTRSRIAADDVGLSLESRECKYSRNPCTTTGGSMMFGRRLLWIVEWRLHEELLINVINSINNNLIIKLPVAGGWINWIHQTTIEGWCE